MVALGLDTSAFDDFSLYWSVLLVVVIGAYLPLEQIVARRSAGGSSAQGLSRWSIRWGGGAAAAGTLAFVALVPGLSESGSAWGELLVLVLAANLVATTFQSVLRGLAAGRGRLDHYALITTADGGLRTVSCGVLAVAGAEEVVLYAGAIALGCWGSVLLGWLALRRTASEVDQAAPSATTLSLEALSLTPAVLAMQLLLNSPVPLASHAGPGASAGAVLAISSLVRTSVFAMQAGQAAYVARIASSVADDDYGRAREVTFVVIGFTGVLAGATAAGAGLLGPWLVGLLFGEDLVAGRWLCLAIGLGVSLYLLAIVANDLSVAWGVHRDAGWYWAAGALAAAGSLPLLPDEEFGVAVPLVIGSAVALTLTVLRPRAVGSPAGSRRPGRRTVRRGRPWRPRRPARPARRG